MVARPFAGRRERGGGHLRRSTGEDERGGMKPRDSTPVTMPVRLAPDPAARRAWLDARRRSHAERMTALYAPAYDEHWGEIMPSHAAFVDALLARTREGGTILDAACGTGKYWPIVLASGRTVVGVDQAAGMLAVAAAKHPDVPVGRVGLQELAFDAVFDAVMCVDALENVGPEDWPIVLARLARAARPGAPVYMTVEQADEGALAEAYEAARRDGHPVLPREEFDGIGYHHYPEAGQVHAWLAETGLETLDELLGEEYLHLLLRRPG
jgi:ubiquinone/menaquinone biosynthesis C-methylase UbiE